MQNMGCVYFFITFSIITECKNLYKTYRQDSNHQKGGKEKKRKKKTKNSVFVQ